MRDNTWILKNWSAGFPVGTHDKHLTSYESNVAVSKAGNSPVAYCHVCEGFVPEFDIAKIADGRAQHGDA